MSATTRNVGYCLRGCIRFLGYVSLLLLACISLSAQSNTGRILGAVSDQSGGVIAGAAVTVTNVETGVARNLTTDADGEYNAPNLSPGTYTVRATSAGFQALERQGILVEVGKDIRVDAQLSPGQVTQTIQVTETAPLLDTTSATIGGTINNATISDLPLNGRNYQRLLVLRPGQVQTPGGGTNTQESNGLRPEDSNYYVDGLDNNEPYFGQSIVNSSLPSGDAATILPIDTIQEFNVENNPPAEFGRKAGAVVNVGIKSGTNTLHGSAYAFGRDAGMDARNYFNPPPTPVAPLDFEQWGFTAGGPIKKDKIFYYGAFERQTYTAGNSFTANIPTTAAGAGTKFSIPDAEAALTNAGIPISPLSVNLLPLYGPNASNSGQVQSGFPNVVSIYNILGKIDYHPNDHNTINGSYFRGHGNGLTQDSPQITQLNFRSTATLLSQFVTTSWTWTPNSTWVNDLRGGWTFYDRPVFTVDHNTDPITYGLNTGITTPLLFGLPNITVAGLTALGGGSNWPNEHGPTNDYDLVDQVSYLHGKHAFKFGGEIFTFSAGNATYSKGRGTFAFNAGSLDPTKIPGGGTGLEAFLAGVPANGKLLVGSQARDMKQWLYSGFIEDVWRFTPHVTVNLGLRYEYDQPLSEANNLIGSWEPTVGFEQAGINSVNGNHVVNGDHKDVSPRIGLAWDIGGKGKTVVRAGYGIYYENIVLSPFIGQVGVSNASTTGINAVPTGFSVVSPAGVVSPALQGGSIASAAVTFATAQLNWVPAPGGPIFPAQSTSGTAFECGNGIKPNPSPCSILVPNVNLTNPRISTWNLNVQHSFTSNLSLETAYVGNHSKGLPGLMDINQAAPGSQAPGCGAGLTAANCLQLARPFYSQFPYLGFINYFSNIDVSNYNALQVALTERNYHKLSVLVGYTYSHALDDMSHYFSGTLPQNSFAPGLEYGSSDFDIRQHFTLSLTYDIPGKKGFGQLLEGWSLNSLVTLQSGLPFNAIDATDNLSLTGEFADHWDFFGNPKDFQATRNAIPFFAGSVPNPNGGPNVINPALPASCVSQATAIGTFNPANPNNPAGNLFGLGCYIQGSSVFIAPPSGTFGTAGRNIFRDSGFRNWDLSVFKNWKFKERLTAQFRAEFFNVLNHPNFANPTLNATNDPSGATFGAENATPDVAAVNPILGTGGPREIQLGLKLLF